MNGRSKHYVSRWSTVIALLLGSLSAQAVPVDATNTTAIAAASGSGTTLIELDPVDLPGFFVPESFSDFDAAEDTAAVAGSVTGSNAQANATVFGDVNSEANATTGPNAVAPLRANASSLGGWVATITTAGLGVDPGTLIDVDLEVTLHGFLSIADTASNAGGAPPNICSADADFAIAFPDLCGAIPDISATVSLLVALADTLDDPSVGFALGMAFNGSATLRTETLGEAPILELVGDYTSRIGDFKDVTPGGMCTAEACIYEVMTNFTIPNADSLGFGNMFDLGILTFTDASVLAGSGTRTGSSDFFGTGGVVPTTANPNVSFVLANANVDVPEPGALLLVSLGLVPLLANARRRCLRG